MEESKSLNQGQVWAQIGTSSYDPAKKQAPAAKDSSNEENGNETTQSKPADESQSEGGKKPHDALSDRKPKNMLGDGFESSSSSSNTDDRKDKHKRSRSRSRSRERRRSRSRSPGYRKMYSDYSTNSRNLSDMRSRVFIGHLNTDQCTQEEVEELFKQYGPVKGVNLQHGYGFVQFEDEDSARSAIKNLHSTTFKGTQLVVDKTVALRKAEERMQEKSHERERDYPSRKELMEEIERLRRRERDREYMYRDYPPRSYDMSAERYYERERRDVGAMDYYRSGGPPTMPPATPYYGGSSAGASGGGGGGYGDQYRRSGSYDRYKDDPYSYNRDSSGYYGDRYGSRLPPRR